MTLRYTIKANPAAGTYLVELEVNARDELLLRMPAWLPGSYMIRDMAAEVQSIEILCGSKKQLIQKIDKSTWRAKLNEKLQKVRIRYEVFAQDPSVRRAYLDDERGFITFSSLCLLPVGFEAAPVEVDIRKPKNKATGTEGNKGAVSKVSGGAESHAQCERADADGGTWEAEQKEGNRRRRSRQSGL